jgi:hypothetical protein
VLLKVTVAEVSAMLKRLGVDLSGAVAMGLSDRPDQSVHRQQSLHRPEPDHFNTGSFRYAAEYGGPSPRRSARWSSPGCCVRSRNRT